MPAKKRSRKALGSTVLGAVKVCKLSGRGAKKKLVCRSIKSDSRLGSTVLNGAKFATDNGVVYGVGSSAAAARRNAMQWIDGGDPRSLEIEDATSAAAAYVRKHGWDARKLRWDSSSKMWRLKSSR